MYGFKSYLKRGKAFANNNLFTSNKKLSTLMLYSTDLCDSKCKHCLIWTKRPSCHLPFEKIKEIMSGKCVTKGTLVGLEGGEFLLHPEAFKIMEWLRANHPYFDLLSNCLKPEKTIEAVKKFPPTRLYISFDGPQKTYEYMRGKDGHDSVIKVIEELKDTVPISVMFTLTPFNNFEDMEYVAQICKKNNIDMRVGLYNDISFFDTIEKAHETDIGTTKDKDSYKLSELKKAKEGGKLNKNEELAIKERQNISDPKHDAKKIKDSYIKDNIPPIIKDFKENFDFLVLYDEWRKKHLRLKCYSIRDSLVVLPNGDIPICQNLELKIGNVFKNSLDDIFNGKETRNLHEDYVHNCNQCWVNFHRKYDVVLYRSLEKIMPKKFIELFLGKYQWAEDNKITYAKYLKQAES